MKLKIMLNINCFSNGSCEFFKPVFKEVDLGAGIAPGMILSDSLWGDNREVVMNEITIDTGDPSKYRVDLQFDDFDSKEAAERYYNLALEHHGWSASPDHI